MPRRSSRALWTAKLASGGVGDSPHGRKGGGRGSSGKSVSAEAEFAARMARKQEPFVGSVLGIDPSLRGTGLALVGFHAGRAPVLRMSRTVKVSAGFSMVECLGEIARAVAALLEAEPVDAVALKQTIYVQNFQTAQILGAARGAAIAPAAMRGVPVFEYAPLRIKQAVVGYGRASKEQVGGMVRSLLELPDLLAADESDAAGAALCHAFTQRRPL